MDFYKKVKASSAELTDLRRDFHRFPELAFQEERTSRIIAQRLMALGLEVRTGVGQTGVVGLLEGAMGGPTLLLRADMDALPIQEENDVSYISKTPGIMHACGHDAHMAILLLVAELLSAYRETMRGRVKFVFQPAEEITKGAKAMVEDGVLSNPHPDLVFGLHVWTALKIGEIAVTSGPFMAAADRFICYVKGSGGHAAQPESLTDPIVATGQIISALQSIVSRNVNPVDPSVVTISAIQAGEKSFNILPSVVELRGIIRTFDNNVRTLIHKRLHDICSGIGEALGCNVELQIEKLTQPVINDTSLAGQVRAIANRIPEVTNVLSDFRTTASEDVAYLMDDIPGCYFFVGAGHRNSELVHPHHHPCFNIDEESMVIGTAMLANIAAEFLFE